MNTSIDFKQILAKHGRTFHLASRLLPASRRDDAALLYAFCRYIDDVADETPDKLEAERDLVALRSELCGDESPRPIVELFLDLASRRGLDVQAAVCLVDAVMSDLKLVRIANDQELIRYCYGVAGTVGLMMCGVLGVRSDEALHFAIDLGIGMQLTNICRDILEDAKRDRCYIPQSRLEAKGLSHETVIAGTCDPRILAEVTDDLLAVAEQYYSSGDMGMRDIPLPGRAAILVAARVYRAIGWRLQRVHKSNSLHGRTVVPQMNRIWWATRALVELLHPLYWLTKDRDHEQRLHLPLIGLPGASANV
jgi:15-cis-phytoene synthase